MNDGDPQGMFKHVAGHRSRQHRKALPSTSEQRDQLRAELTSDEVGRRGRMAQRRRQSAADAQSGAETPPACGEYQLDSGKFKNRRLLRQALIRELLRWGH